MNINDDRYMKIALTLSRRGLGRCAPNPTVGAVIVRFERVPVIVGRGWTMPSGRPHAETMALEAAGEKARGATLYVTLEPCSHYGKTPPCADAVISAGIARVVYAAKDPDERVAGRGLEKLKNSGIEVTEASSECIAEAQWIMRGHILRHTENRPFVQLKLAVDADLRVPRGSGTPLWITGTAARERAHLLRARTDAILIGRGTAETDNPSLTCRLPGMDNRSPIRVLLDKSLQTPVTNNIFRDLEHVPLWIFCDYNVDTEKLRAVREAGAQVIHIITDQGTGMLSVNAILSSLAERGITRLMIEGGPAVSCAFLENGTVDEIVLFQSDSRIKDSDSAIEVTGLKTVIESRKYQFVSETPVGEDRMKIYRIREES